MAQDNQYDGTTVARAFPLYSRKTGSASQVAPRQIYVQFMVGGVPFTDGQTLLRVANAAEGIRLAARLVETPAGELNVSTYLDEIYALKPELDKHGATITVIRGEELRDQGFGGLWGVGKGSDHPPALVKLSYQPDPAKKTIVMVGKGIVFDTGGLQIKGKDTMPHMKTDMGGSAAVLAAFVSILKSGCAHNLHAILCIAENSVDSRSMRPDDILQLYSGKTVEINNTDAEGRLVLGDGVAYATKHLAPDVLVDLATLTGAQSYATGTRHAGVLTPSEELERLVVAAGKTSGDLVYPLIYSPEFFGIAKQFASDVADMKNSVKDRSNAQSSCAGHFIQEHLVGENWKTPEGWWAHLDIAYPATFGTGGLATGYGVALLMDLVKLI
ncbi:aminopeptidase-like 1, isoform CRA_d [Cladochytrium replicatum]|nr:aminopeptidase-like 1, isoform CRA_d [Cladochytrium replicatum]